MSSRAPTRLTSRYYHLADLAVRKGDRVRPGQQLGRIGDNPLDQDARHLHFEIRKRVGTRHRDLNPGPYLAHAKVT